MEGGELPPEGIENEEFPNQRRKKKKKKKRFTDDQINLLESMFETDTKLEPKRKLQLARELELQPRQVAIWFQNRRARWKSKHLEQEYNLLKHNYDNLNSQYHSLCDQQQTLRAQLQKLRDTLTETDDEDTNGKLKLNPTNTQSDTENKGYVAAQYEEPQLLNLCRHLDTSSIPTDKWCNFDHTSATSNWLDFLA